MCNHGPPSKWNISHQRPVESKFYQLQIDMHIWPILLKDFVTFASLLRTWTDAISRWWLNLWMWKALLLAHTRIRHRYWTNVPHGDWSKSTFHGSTTQMKVYNDVRSSRTYLYFLCSSSICRKSSQVVVLHSCSCNQSSRNNIIKTHVLRVSPRP